MSMSTELVEKHFVYVLFSLLSVGVGALTVIQGSMNIHLAETLGHPLRAASFNFYVGALTLMSIAGFRYIIKIQEGVVEFLVEVFVLRRDICRTCHCCGSAYSTCIGILAVSWGLNGHYLCFFYNYFNSHYRLQHVFCLFCMWNIIRHIDH